MHCPSANVSNDLGAPPAWTPLDEPHRLEEDSGSYFRDTNAARCPNYPLEPAVRTVLAETEGLKAQEVDLFACSSTVGSLLRFVRRIDKSFRFFVEAVGNTVFFTRHENSPTQVLVGVRGYGHTFPDAYTTWDADVKGSTSHQRLLKYKLAGLDCILRFECDGYLPSKVPGGVSTLASVGDQKSTEGEPDLASLLERAKVSSSLTGKIPQQGPLQISKSGQKIPQAAVFDLKTRSGRKKGLSVLDDELPRYWLAQIPNFILARHDGRGLFDDISVQDVRDDVEEWQAANQEDIRRLIWLLHKIIDAVKARPDRKLEMCCKDLDALELRLQDTDKHDVLPPELKLRWMEEGPGQGSPVDKGPASDEGEDEDDDPTRSKAFRTATGSDIDSFDSDDGSEKDYTACSADSCGYCGHCSY